MVSNPLESSPKSPGDSARDIYEAAIRRWGRVRVRGSRDGLAQAADELLAMGDIGTPFANKLLARVAELDAEDERNRRLIEWCDRSPSQGLLILGDGQRTLGRISTDFLPEERAARRTEDGRRLSMIGVAHEARLIQELVSGGLAVVQLEGLPEERLDESQLHAFDWRFASDFEPSPIPSEIVSWWQSNRGFVRVRCLLHGEIARFDLRDSIGLLCAAWDAAVVEYHARWERRWDETYDTPDFDGCDVRIESIDTPGNNLLDVMEMWISLEGGRLPWWPHELML